MLHSYQTAATTAKTISSAPPFRYTSPEAFSLPNTPSQPNSQRRILLIEPDIRWRERLALRLQHAGYTVIMAEDGLMGLTQFTLDERIDLVLVASRMPLLSGLDVCIRLRRHSQIPVVLLSDAYNLEEALFSLQLGADDYLDRSNWWPVLLARIQARLRRVLVEQPPAYADMLVVNDLVVDQKVGTVTVGGQAVSLTPLESRLLLYLTERAGCPVDPTELLQAVWGYCIGETNLVRVAIHRLRKKIERDPDQPVYILKVYGGYQFGSPALAEKSILSAQSQ